MSSRRPPALIALALLFGVAGCATTGADQPIVGAAPATSTGTTVGRSEITASVPAPGASSTSIARTPGEVIAAPVAPPGPPIAVADLASFVPAERVAGEHADPPLVNVRFTADERARRATVETENQAVLVDGATKNGWIAGLDAIPANSSPLDARQIVTIELFATPEGASAYAAIEAPYWNPTPATLDLIDTPEIPGSRSYRVRQFSSGTPVTQVNVTRGPVYVKVATYERGVAFTVTAIDATVATARDVIARVDRACGSTCNGDPASAATTPSPPTFTVGVGACVDLVSFAPAAVTMPRSLLREVSCTEPHSGEVVGAYPAAFDTYPASPSAVISALAPANIACDSAVVTAQRTANAAATSATNVGSAVFQPSPAEYDAGRRDGLCVVAPDDGSLFTAKYLASS